MSELFGKIYAVVREIPEGSVLTYGQVARLAGNHRASRAVGFALHRPPEGLPCHRVVFKDGSLCKAYIFGGEEVQRGLLEGEGVCFLDDGRVDLSKSGII